MINNNFKLFFVILTSSFIFSEEYLLNKNYITGEDGVIRMYINVIGHVKKPGNYLVYDKIDLLSAISIAGGTLPGANLKKIIIYKKNGDKLKLDFNKIFSSDISNTLEIEAHDTIIIEQKKISQFLLSSNLPTLFLSLLNLAITLENSD